MEEKKIKKKKLTLTISSKKPYNISNYSLGKQKTSVVIEKKVSRNKNNRRFYNRGENVNKQQSGFQGKPKPKPQSNFSQNTPTPNRNFEIRKIAEERATKRFKSSKENVAAPRKGNFGKNVTSKRESKLTVTKALTDDLLDGKERSLASVRRARLKEKKNQETENKIIETKKIVHEVNIPDKITIQELSNRMAMQASAIIKHLLGMGVVATINHTIDADTAEYLVKEFGNVPIRYKKPDLNILKVEKKDSKNLKSRSPIVTVMGHVDHGKTSLLDALRKTNVVAGEHGGITQHIGAYQIKAETKKGKSITFIDTPGHSAFTEMRARGSKVTDIVVLVVAADDGVKPQTIEAIEHAKAAKVPIIVAINKSDLPAADPQKIKNQLLQYELIAEELSGDTLFVEVSATTKKNLDKLKENIILQADLLDLKANLDGSGTGVILESRIDKGKGPVSTVLVTNGKLKKGDFFVSGNNKGKIRAMINDEGQNVDEALPSTPVEVLGMNKSALAGDDFVVVDSEDKAKEINDYRIEQSESKQVSPILANKESAFDYSEGPKELPIIIKSDVHGSSEAIKNAIQKIKHAEVVPKIILSSIGVITETDVTLASASKAILIGFNVKPSKEAKKLAENHKITIKFFNIIYEVLDFLNNSLSGLLKPDVKEEIVGSAEVKAIFKVSQIGKVAGSKVIDGEIINNLNARLIRDGNVLYTGSIGSIFREKNAAKQVSAGLECGITLKDFADFKEKDVIEVYKVIETERRIND